MDKLTIVRIAIQILIGILLVVFRRAFANHAIKNRPRFGRSRDADEDMERAFLQVGAIAAGILLVGLAINTLVNVFE